MVSVEHLCELITYKKTPADVLKARLKTSGVVEHTFRVRTHGTTVIWKLYDVGGSQNQRQAWIPYFEDGKITIILTLLTAKIKIVDAIIFLVAISAFDQVRSNTIPVFYIANFF